MNTLKKEPKFMLHLVSLLLALLMWVNLSGRYRDTDQDQVRVFPQVPLLHKNTPTGMKLKSDSYQIRVAVSGPEDDLARIDANALSVTLDLEGLQPSTYNLPLTEDNVVLPKELSRLRVENIIPDMVKLTLVDWSVKKVDLFVGTTGSPAENFELEALKVTPQQVTIEGPTDQVKDVAVVITESIDIEGADKVLAGRLRIDFRSLRDIVIREDLASLKYEAVIKERETTKRPSRPYTLQLAENEIYKLAVNKAKAEITGPISVMSWMDPTWLNAEVLIPKMIDEDPIEKNQAEATPGSATPEGEAAPQLPALTVPISTRWDPPEEVKNSTPDWFSRVSRLKVKWLPGNVEVVEP